MYLLGRSPEGRWSSLRLVRVCVCVLCRRAESSRAVYARQAGGGPAQSYELERERRASGGETTANMSRYLFQGVRRVRVG